MLASTRVYLATFCALMLSGTVAHVAGQNAQAPQWSIIMIAKIKPESRAEYEALQKELISAYKKAGVPSRAVLQTIFGDLTEYISVSPLGKFSEMDGSGPLEWALGADGAAKLRRRSASLTAGTHRMAGLAMPELSLRTPAKQPAPYALVVTSTLAPGKGMEWETYMKSDYLPVLRKAEIPNFWVSRTVFGGEGMDRVTVRPMQKLGEIDDGPIARRALGREGAAKLNAKSAGLYQSIRYRVVRYRADLSYEPEPARVTQGN